MFVARKKVVANNANGTPATTSAGSSGSSSSAAAGTSAGNANHVRQPVKLVMRTVAVAPPQTLDERKRQQQLKRQRERHETSAYDSSEGSDRQKKGQVTASKGKGRATLTRLRKDDDNNDDGAVLESRQWSAAQTNDDEEDIYADKRGPLRVPRVDLAAQPDSLETIPVITATHLVAPSIAGYEKYFPDLDDSTSAIIEMPGDNASEEFPLLVPRAKITHEYYPLYDLTSAVRTVCDYYLTAEQSLQYFQYIQNTSGSATFGFLSASSSEPAIIAKSASPAPQDPLTIGNGTRTSTPVSDVGTPEPSPSLLKTAFENVKPISSGNTDLAMPATFGKDSIVRALDKALKRRNGALFMAALNHYNTVIRMLKGNGSIPANVNAFGADTGVPEGLWQRIALQCYERTVGPGIEKLRKYAAFSDNTYGELLPPLLSHIASMTGLKPGMTLVDLGSGVGNCCVQIALATGCAAYGVENQVDASAMARLQVEEMKARSRLWGLQAGPMAVHEADFLESPQIVNPLINSADVILVNNFVFSPLTNERLSLMFPGLKEGAQIVSLRPFCERAGAAPISDRNENAIESILIQSKPIHFGRRNVSWTDEGGRYYIATVDRSRRRAFEEAKGSL